MGTGAIQVRQRASGCARKIPIRPFLASFIANVGGWRERLLGGSGTASNTDHIQSLAVLPLASLSRDPGQDYFADGMTEALITELKLGMERVKRHG